MLNQQLAAQIEKVCHFALIGAGLEAHPFVNAVLSAVQAEFNRQQKLIEDNKTAGDKKE